MAALQHKISDGSDCECLTVLADKQIIRLSGEETGGVYTLIEQYNPPGVSVPPHVHEREDETFHVIEGAVEFTVYGKPVLATAGTTVFVPRGVPHSFKFVGEPTSKVLLFISPAGIEKMFRELSKLPPGPPDMAQLGEICSRYGIRFA